jgi:flagellar basal body rod protein FlgG
MNVRALVAGGVLVVGLGGCASQPEWMSMPVPNAGPVGDRAMAMLRAQSSVAIENLANIDTPGYKGTVAIGPDRRDGRLVTEINQNQGPPMQSDRPLDLMLNGPGFFRVSDERGLAYTRFGRFTRNADGELVLALGAEIKLDPPITVPVEATGISIEENGVVSCTMSSLSPEERVEIGRIIITTFVAPERLTRDGVVFRETAQAGPPIDQDLGVGTKVLQNYYECSNVDPMLERVHIERARRAMGLWSTEPMDRALATRSFSAQ